jgi:hypothetical protein
MLLVVQVVHPVLVMAQMVRRTVATAAAVHKLVLAKLVVTAALAS